MISIGVDAHKQIHVAIALDDAGREIGRWRGANSQDGWKALGSWALALGADRQWGIEGAWNYGRGLGQSLVIAGETIYEVNPRWTALGRRHARRPGKTDRLDARAVALFVRQEAPHLPPVAADDVTALLDLLTSQRESAVAETTRLRNQIHALLLQLDPQYQDQLPNLDSQAGLIALASYEARGPSALQQERAAIVRRLAERLRLAADHAADLKRQIETYTKAAGFAPLTAIHGVGPLIAGTLAGILGPGARFAPDAELAAYAGAAPLEASSAGLVRHRLNRGGNRRLNSLLHMIALTQLRSWPPARTYMARRISEGKTRREAMRALKRFLVRAIWNAWKQCLVAAPQSVAAGEAPSHLQTPRDHDARRVDREGQGLICLSTPPALT
jgi:transposase